MTDQVDAERCAPTKYKMIPVMKVFGLWRPIAYCEDGTKANPCCGKGKCNAFCRNCVGGCRKGREQVIADGTIDPVTIANHQVVSMDAVEAMEEDMREGGMLVADGFNPTMANAEMRIIRFIRSDHQAKNQLKHALYSHVFGGGSSLRRYGGEFGRPFGIGYGRPYFSRPAV